MMYIRGYHRDITPADVDEMSRQLLLSKAMHEREIALSLAAAEALRPIAHYKTINVRVTRQIVAAIDDTRARISYTRNRHSWQTYPEYVHVTVWQGFRDPAQMASATATVDIKGTVADLIAAYEKCEYSRMQLERVTNQLARIEEILDAEEHIRGLVKEIEETRKRMALDILGVEGNFWHDTIRDHLPALAGER